MCRTSAVRWLAHNALTELLSASTNYCRLRYEDFLAHPDAALSKILAPYEWSKDDSTHADSGMETVLEPAHTVSGNRMRFKSGNLRLELDDEWREVMSKRDRQTVEAITWPLLTRYGYRFGSNA